MRDAVFAAMLAHFHRECTEVFFRSPNAEEQRSIVDNAHHWTDSYMKLVENDPTRVQVLDRAVSGRTSGSK